jgi:membrane protease YdiL (CAAX protease family)
MPNDSSKPDTNGRPRLRAWIALLSILSVVVLYFLTQVIGLELVYTYSSLVGRTGAETVDWLKNSVYAQFFFVLISYAALAAALYGVMRLFQWSWRTIGLTKPKLKYVGYGLLAVVPYFVLYLIMVGIVQQFYPQLNIDQKQEIGFTNTKTAVELVVVFISLVILPPIVEEIAMRGFLYSGLRTAFPKILSALVVSVVFGLAHLAQGGDSGPLWIGFIDTFTLSMVLVFLREKTGNLWAGITLHATKNCVAFVALFILAAR